MWYVANLFFQAVRDDGTEDLCEERFVLFDAVDETEASFAVEIYGKENEHSYRAADGGNLSWLFKGMGKLYQIEADYLENGTELYSRFLEDDH